MQRCASGLTVICLALWLTGCELLPTRTVTVPIVVQPEVPPHLTEPLAAPRLASDDHRGLVDLLTDHRALLDRANTDRRAVREILDHDHAEAD